MADESQKNVEVILDNIPKIRKDITDYKTELFGQLDTLGKAEALLDTSEKVFKALKVGNTPEYVTSSGVATTQTLMHTTNLLGTTYVRDIKKAGDAAGTILASAQYLAATAGSATLSHPDMQPKAWDEIRSSLESTQNRTYVEVDLTKVGKHLGAMYKNAWFVQGALQDDTTRQPASNIREIIYQLLHQYAPDDKIKEEAGFVPDPTSKTGVTQQHRIKYIAKRANDSDAAKQLEDIAADYSKLISSLSIGVHKHGEIEEKEAMNDLYRADALLQLLLKCIRSL